MNPILLTGPCPPFNVAPPSAGRAACRFVHALTHVGNQLHALGTETRAGMVRGIKILFPPARRVVFESARFRDHDPHRSIGRQDPHRQCSGLDTGCDTGAKIHGETDGKDHFSALPVEILQTIGGHLGHVELMRMGATCHRLRKVFAGQATVATIKAYGGFMISASQLTLIVRQLDHVRSRNDLDVCEQQVLNALRHVPTAELPKLDGDVRGRIQKLLSVSGNLPGRKALEMIEAVSASGCEEASLRQHICCLPELPRDEQERMMGWLPSVLLDVGEDSVRKVVRELVTSPPFYQGTVRPCTFIALARLVQWLPVQEWGDMFHRLAMHVPDQRFSREWSVSGLTLLLAGLQPEKHRDAFVFLSSLLQRMPLVELNWQVEAPRTVGTEVPAQPHRERVADSLLVLRIATFDQAGACHRLLDRLAALGPPDYRGQARRQLHGLATNWGDTHDYRQIIRAMNDDLNAGPVDESMQLAIHALVARYVRKLGADDRKSFVHELLHAGLQMRFMDAVAFSNLRTVLDTLSSNEQRLIIYLLARTPSDNPQSAEKQDGLLRGLLESRQGEWHRAKKAILEILERRAESRRTGRQAILMP